MSIEEMSKAELYVQQKSWEYRATDNQLILEICPISQCDNYHFYMRRGGEKDGLFDCKHCGQSGNLYQLREKMGDVEKDIESMKAMANEVKKPDALPDILKCQGILLADEMSMNYLFDVRGFSADLIKERMLGQMNQNGKRYLVIPYIEQNRCVFAKYRTLPPAEKGFFSPKGREAGLYNVDALTQNMDEILFVEGEMDAIACIGKGIRNVVGVPGANTKKMSWINRLDAAAPKKIYILYDNDAKSKKNIGQEAAEELAKRIALNTSLPTPLNILLPEFETYDGQPGKDINDWFKAGNTVADLEALKAQALPFEVRGVVNVGDALTRLELSLEGKDMLKPTYEAPWPELNYKLGGFEPGDVVDIIATAKVGKSTMGMNIIDHLVASYNEPGLIHCLEMPTERMVRKWVSSVTQTEDSPPRDEEDAKERMRIMRLAIPRARDLISTRQADLLFSDRNVRHPDEVYEMWYQAVRRHGIKFGMFDNLQLLADRTLKRASDRTIHISQISKNFKAMATELRLVLLRIVQPKKVYKGEIASHTDADGSSQIEKDCDASICLHRTQKTQVDDAKLQSLGVINEEMAMEPTLYANVSITRYAPGGICTLHIDGARSTVRTLTPSEYSGVKISQSGMGMATLMRDEETTVEA